MRRAELIAIDDKWAVANVISVNAIHGPRGSGFPPRGNGGLRPAVLAYLMLGAAFDVRDDGDDYDAWLRTANALDRVWYERLTRYERLAFSYESRIAVAEALDEPTC